MLMKCRSRPVLWRGLILAAGIGTVVSGLGTSAQAVPGQTATAETTANVVVGSSITLTALVPSFVLTGNPGDTDLTSDPPVTMLVTTNNNEGYSVSVQSTTPTLNPTSPGNSDTIPIGSLEVKETGAYRVMTSGTGARARVEPFFLVRPKHYEPPDWQGASSRWNLDRGFYVLSLEPRKKGILILTLSPESRAMEPVPPQPVQAAVRFAPLELDSTHRYTAYFNHQPGVTAGLVVRPWPVDLSQPLPVAQKPGEVFEIPFQRYRGWAALRARFSRTG